MNDATVKTERAAGAAYNGMGCQFLRKVERNDVAFVASTPQVVVLIDGKEVYFFADEITRDKPVAEPEPAAPAAPPPAEV